MKAKKKTRGRYNRYHCKRILEFVCKTCGTIHKHLPTECTVCGLTTLEVKIIGYEDNGI